MNFGRLACTVVATLALSQTAEASVVGFWNFDETTGTTAADGSGSGNTASLQSGAAFAPGLGIVGGALDLRNGGFASVPTLNFSGLTQFSIQTWVRLAANDLTPMIVAGQHKAGIVAGYLIGLNDINDGGGPSNNTKAHVYQTYPLTPPSPVVVNDGSWHQVVAVFGATTTTVYVDGGNAASVGRVSIPSTLAQFLIGGLRLANNTDGNAFKGLIDNVAVFNSELSASDVGDLFRASGVIESEVPIPAALPLMATAIGALGLAARRRSRRQEPLP